MLRQILIAFALINILMVCLAQDPTPKKWPDQWQADFTEKIYLPVIGTEETKGHWAYDYANGLFAVSRENGKNDRYCGSIYKLKNTSCKQIVREGKRYMIFPEKKFCCMCCTAENGCGITKPDWFSSGVYNGEHDVGSVHGREFIVKGLQNNYYDEEAETCRPLRIFQDPLSDMVFDVDSYTEENVNSSIFDLPTDSGDCERSCGFLSVCTLLR